MSAFERSAEKIARAMDRRTLLRRSAEAGFLALASGTVVGFRPNPAFANGCQATDGSACSPPGGVYCTHFNSNWCNSGGCNVAGDGFGDGSPCTFYYSDEWSQTACWCTTNACYNCTHPGSDYCGHYKCCDCHCGSNNTKCGCRTFIYTCPGSLAGMEVPVTASTDLGLLTAQLLAGAPERPVCCA